MNTLAVLPVKSFAHAKQRLAEELPPGPRRALTEAMFSDVLVALRRTSGVEATLVVSADNGAQQIAGGHGATVLGDDDQGHNVAAARGIEHALEIGAQRVLLVPGDCPMLDPGELDELLARRVDAPAALVVPDRHGTGTNALVLTPPGAIAPSFGEGSCARHLAHGQETGVRITLAPLPSLALDVDTPEDLEALVAQLAQTHGGAAHTRGMLNQLMRSRAG